MKHLIYRSLFLSVILSSIVVGLGIDPQNLLGQTAILTETITETQALTISAEPPEWTQLLEDVRERARRDVELDKDIFPNLVSDLDIQFGERAKTVGLPITTLQDAYETAYLEAKPVEKWWQQFAPNVGWLTAAILGVLLLLRDVLKDWITKSVNTLGEALYSRLSGTKPLLGFSLRRYRQALVGKYQILKIPFRPDRPLEMAEVYVPPKVSESNDRQLIEATQAISEHKWLTVLGAPGSGKSMLLRSLALTYAKEGVIDLSYGHIPILLELHRLNESDEPLESHLVQTLERNDFPNGETFVEMGLEHGHFILLLDGLDEVNTDRRSWVIGQIKDLLDQHTECRAVITCRTAVYYGEFDGWANQKLEIVEFNDLQIRRFLTSWEPDMPSDKSVKNLILNLYERPRILSLARNPLLLTIIAYLYTDTAFILPHSRAEFYDGAIALLVEQWKRTRNHYKGSHKRLVLQHLALYNQDSAQQNEDRRSMDLATVLREIQAVLPALTLKTEDAQPILDEITERSGLLLAIDGGTRYQFAHLTLQEYFAALALQTDGDGLLSRFQKDYGTWIETAKLWCGIEHDSTRFIQPIYHQDATTAFELLADAQKVDPNFVDQVVSEFKDRLLSGRDMDEPVLRAFATVAADSRRRGKELRTFLMATLADANIERRIRIYAADILARTHLPEVAEILVQYADDLSEIQDMVVQLGNPAVPSLADGVTDDN